MELVLNYLPHVIASLIGVTMIAGAINIGANPVANGYRSRWRSIPAALLILTVAMPAAVGVTYKVLSWSMTDDADPVVTQATIPSVVEGQDVTACRKPGTFDAIDKLVQQRDKDAFRELLMASYRSGECKDLDNGMRVFVTERSLWKGRAKVRPQGALDEWWVLAKHINP